MSLQQLVQQSEDRLDGAQILREALHLRSDYREKKIPYHSASNLSILFTVSGGKQASSYIVNHIFPTFLWRLYSK